MKRVLKSRLEGLMVKQQIKEKEEDKFSLCFNHLMEGFALHRLIVDKNNNPIDFIYKDVNVAYEKITSLKKENIIGKKFSEVFPGCGNRIIDIYRKMILNNTPKSFDYYCDEEDKYFKISTFLIESDEFVSLISDITETVKSKKRNDHLNKVLKAIRTINSLIIKEKDFNELLNKACETLVESIGYDLVWIVLFDKRNHHVKKFFCSDKEFSCKNMNSMSNFLCVEKILKSREFEIFYDLQLQCKSCSIESYFRDKAHLVVPMIFNDCMYGVINVTLAKEYAFDTEENLLFNNLAEDLAYALFNLEIQGDLEVARRRVRRYYQEVDSQNIKLTKVNEALEIKNEQLKKANAKACESEQLKSSFLANISHEIRTPLNGILGFTQLLRRSNESPDKLDEYIDIITKSGDQLLDVINNLLDISKIESNQLMVNLSECDLEQLLDDVYQLNQFYIVENGQADLIVDKISLSKGNKILCDEIKLKQILNILVNNAIKFTKKGYIKFGIKEKDQENLLFFVEDTGIGIEKEKFELIFEAFRQSDESNTKKFGGVGLGLSIAKGLVTLLNGNIWLQSEKNTGTKFYFSIPYLLKEQEQTKIMELDKIETLNWSTKKILIVEDDKFSAEYIMEALEQTNIKIELAKNGHSAIEEIKQNDDFNLILMDIQLPGISGEKATMQIREFNSEIPIIAQTAHAMINDKENYIKAGCNDYISKPISVTDLYSVLCKYL